MQCCRHLDSRKTAVFIGEIPQFLARQRTIAQAIVLCQQQNPTFCVSRHKKNGFIGEIAGFSGFCPVLRRATAPFCYDDCAAFRRTDLLGRSTCARRLTGMRNNFFGKLGQELGR
jgi:hypothetical protein